MFRQPMYILVQKVLMQLVKCPWFQNLMKKMWKNIFFILRELLLVLNGQEKSGVLWFRLLWWEKPGMYFRLFHIQSVKTMKISKRQFSKLMNWYQKLTGKNSEILENSLNKLMSNLQI